MPPNKMQQRKVSPRKLPSTVKPIRLNQMGMLKVDSKTNELYFGNEKVQLHQVVTLDKWQLGWAIFFGVIGVIFGLVNCFYNWTEIEKNLHERRTAKLKASAIETELKIVVHVPKGTKVTADAPLKCVQPPEISSSYYNTTCSGLTLGPAAGN